MPQMKAVVYTEYGPPDVLQLKEIPKPAPKDREILVKVRATSVNIGDLWARNFRAIGPREFSMSYPMWLLSRLMMGVSRPKQHILGSEFSGEVEAVGSGVTRFRVGDELFGYRGPAFGACAEYLCMSEGGAAAAKPVNLTFEEAATVPYGAMTAMGLLRKVSLRPGQRVLILGASGRIGSFALQLARNEGAEVTGVCSTPRMELVRALGADHVIDYTREDFTRNGRTYDLILDVMGKSSFERCGRSLTENGVYLPASFKMRQLRQAWATSRSRGKKVICALSSESAANLVRVKELVEAGKIKTILDQRFSLERTADAHRHLEAGRQAGSVVIVVSSSRRE